MGQLFKKPGSANWWARYTVQGKQVRESTNTTNRKEAELFLSQRIVGNKVPTKASIGSLLDTLIEDYEINGKDAAWCRTYVEKHIRPVFGDLKADRLSTDDLRSFVAAMLKAEYKNATVNRCLALLQRAYKLRGVPYPGFSLLQENNVRKGFLDHMDFWQLYEKLPKHLKPPVLFAFETGCRKSEVLGLKWNQIDEIRVGDTLRYCVRLHPGETKNKQGRVIPLTDLMKQILDDIRPFAKSDYVFTFRGKPIHDIRTGWQKACALAGPQFKGLLFHDMRRSAIRNMVRGGTPEAVAMAISGHKTRSVFDRYNVVDEADLATAMSRYEQSRKRELQYFATTGAPDEIKRFAENAFEPEIEVPFDYGPDK
jgi:integrase